jgi:hypothetical protein
MWNPEVLAKVTDRYDRQRLEQVGRAVCARLRAAPAIDRSSLGVGELRLVVRGETPLGEVRVAFDTHELAISSRLPAFGLDVGLWWVGQPEGQPPDELVDDDSDETEPSIPLSAHVRTWVDSEQIASIEVWSRLPAELRDELDRTLGAGHNTLRVEEGRLELEWEEPMLDRSLDGMLGRLLTLHLKLMAALPAAWRP